MAEQMTPEKAAALRAPFPPETVGKLPKPYKKDSPKGNCHECGGYHGLPAVHLDYVGHAAVTDRLLQVDPAWTWEPVAVDPQTGAPLIVNGGLWIRLTVCGVTRLGWGDSASGSVKECIGDAVRNAAMRFGVALDLWAKESLVEGQHDGPSPGVAKPDPAAHETRVLRQQIAELATAHGWDVSVLGQEFTQTYGVSTSTATPDGLRDYLARLEVRVAEQAAAALGAASEAAAVTQAPDPQVVPDGSTVALQPHDDAPPTQDAPAVEDSVSPTDWRDLLLAATSKPEVIHLLRDLSLAGLADAEVGDANGEPVTLNTLATRRMKEAGA